MNEYILHLECIKCGREYDPRREIYLCEDCGMVSQQGVITLPGMLAVEYRYQDAGGPFRKALQAGKRLNRFRHLLPWSESMDRLTLGEGGTALLPSYNLAGKLGLKHLYIKDETTNPSGCFKDRETMVVVGMGKEWGKKHISCASTGSGAASMAAYGARTNLESHIFIPAGLPRAKLLQMLIHKSHVVMVGGIYEDALGEQIKASAENEWYNCSPGINPFRVEGNKTIAYEICEDLNWQAPDRVIIPTGGGGNLAGEWKGFKEMQHLEFVNSLPRMTAVQMEAGCSLAASFYEGRTFPRVVPVRKSVAGSLLSTFADYGVMALRALVESDGNAVIISDEEIIEARNLLAETEGIFTEPAGAGAVAGLMKMQAEGKIDPGEVVVCVVTGTGLRDTETALKEVEKHQLTTINPSHEGVKGSADKGGRN